MEKQDETDHEGGEDEEDSFFAGWSDVGRETLVEGQKANAGYLWKRGERNTGWKMRFFVFDGDVLRGARITYYVDDSQKTRKGAIDLSTLTGLEAPLEPSGAVEEAPGRGFDLRLPARGGRVWQLKAPTRHIRDTWARRIAALLNVPFEEMGPTTEETQRREASLDFREAMAKRQRIYVQATVVGWCRREEADKKGQFTAFEVQVRTNASFLFDDQTVFSAHRRYSDFAELVKLLAPYRRPEMLQLPYIPPRHYKQRFSGALLEQRRQAFDALLHFWIDAFVFVAGLPLPLLHFLEPPPDADFHRAPAGSVAVARELAPTVPARLPPLLRFQGSAASFAERFDALQTWLAHHHGPISAPLVARAVESVGGLSSHQRQRVAELLAPFVEPERMFLVTELVPTMQTPCDIK